MIEFHYKTNFKINNEGRYASWIKNICMEEGSRPGELVYVFVGDPELHKMNIQYLDHDDYTDILTFESYSASGLSGDIFISVDRVRENATLYHCDFEEELLRVMAHGVLHLLGYKDKSPEEERAMRRAEERSIKLFHVEHE